MRIAYNPGDALTYAPNSEDIIFDLAGEAIFAKGVRFDGKLHTVFRKEYTNDGINGLVPHPDYNEGSSNRFLREDGTWEVPYTPIQINGIPVQGDEETVMNLIPKDFIKLDLIGRNVEISTTYETATPKKDGLMSSEDKSKLDYLTYDPNTFDGVLGNSFNQVSAGGNLLESKNNQCLSISSGVGINITSDTNNQSMLIEGVVMTGANGSDGESGLVPKPSYDDSNKYLKGDGSWGDSIRHSDNATNADNADTVDGWHISVGSAGSEPNTIYFVL